VGRFDAPVPEGEAGEHCGGAAFGVQAGDTVRDLLGRGGSGQVPIVDLLAELARGGPALEFAVGTGRVALRLAARGLAVHGIELSPHMAERLLAKPGAEAVPVTIGDMTTTRVPGTFTLAYLVATPS
jgi:hypothetical protein